MSTAEPVGVGITTEGTNMYKKTESSRPIHSWRKEKGAWLHIYAMFNCLHYMHKDLALTIESNSLLQT